MPTTTRGGRDSSSPENETENVNQIENEDESFDGEELNQNRAATESIKEMRKEMDKIIKVLPALNDNNAEEWFDIVEEAMQIDKELEPSAYFKTYMILKVPRV